MDNFSRSTRLILCVAIALLAAQTLASGAMAAKEKFERTKPHVNVGTIGHVDDGPDQLATEADGSQAVVRPTDCETTPNGPDGTPRPECATPGQ
jgi:hypothetical protein